MGKLSRVGWGLVGALGLGSCGHAAAPNAVDPKAEQATESVPDEQAASHGIKLFEASGVVRRGSELLLVHDEVPGAYFCLTPEDVSAVATYKSKHARMLRIPGASKVKDMEGIALGAGQVFVLSEKGALLQGPDGTRYSYAKDAQVIGNRGLEGLAIRARVGQKDLVASLFEGGYLNSSYLSKQQKKTLGGTDRIPFVIVHELPDVGQRLRQETDPGARKVELSMESMVAEVQAGQRFRAVDLVWHAFDAKRWGWIVLLVSDAAPGSKQKAAHLWLQRFDDQGQAVGLPLDLAQWLRAQGKSWGKLREWEGLGWWQPAEKLVLVDDTGKRKSHLAFVPLPDEWKADSPGD